MSAEEEEGLFISCLVAEYSLFSVWSCSLSHKAPHDGDAKKNHLTTSRFQTHFLHLHLHHIKNQKKKYKLTTPPQCDQSQPSCSRCTRLKIRCIGSGTQRFKFHNATSSNPRHTPVSVVPSRPLQNQVSATIGSLIQTLEVDDPRFCIVSLGGFFEDVPRRLGRNEALDAAARAFSVTMSVVRTGRITVPMLTDYGVALKALRRLFVVGGEDKVVTVETLVAIYLVMICQVRFFVFCLFVYALLMCFATVYCERTLRFCFKRTLCDLVG